MSNFGSYGNQFSPNVNGFAFFNKYSTVDKTMLAFAMWKTTIRMSIYPLIESDNDEQIKYDRKAGVSIYLTPYKAHMLVDLIQRFKKDPESVHLNGVPAGQALVSVEDPKRPDGFNKKDANPIIVIRKVNQESGMVECSYAYEVNSNSYGIVENYDDRTGSFSTNTKQFELLELDMICLQLEKYCEAMTNATAFTVLDAVYPSLEKIAGKLGVELNPSNYNNNYKGSYFNSNNATPSGNSVAGGSDNLESMMG